MPQQGPRVVVIGGGMAGLAAATLLARAGASVTVLERAPRWGGRAAVREAAGFIFNQGPRALYLGGPAQRLLRTLDVPYSGRAPGRSVLFLGEEGARWRLPGHTLGMLGTGWLRARERLELLRVLAGLRTALPASSGLSARDWLDGKAQSLRVRALLGALVRQATYAAELEVLDAEAARAQLAQAVFRGVRYLDGGWDTLVTGLEASARRAGVQLHPRARAVQVQGQGQVEAVLLGDGSRLQTEAVVLALSPPEAAALVPTSRELQRWAQGVHPVRAACWEVALDALPPRGPTMALGLVQPTYLSLHSRWARLAPAGKSLFHVAEYLRPDDPAPSRATLEPSLEAVMPRWREHVVTEHFLPAMTVAWDLPRADRGGLAGRAGVSVPDMDGLFRVGDAVGPQGMLADAALASAEAAAQAIGRHGQAEPLRSARAG